MLRRLLRRVGRSGVVAVRRSGHGRRRPVAGLLLGVLRRVRLGGHLLLRVLLSHVGRLGHHRSSREGRRRVALVEAGLGVHALHGRDVPQLGVGAGLLELWCSGVRP